MCGIFFVQNFLRNGTLEKYKKSLLENIKTYQHDFSKISHRGPDNSIFLNDKQFSKNYNFRKKGIYFWRPL